MSTRPSDASEIIAEVHYQPHLETASQPLKIYTDEDQDVYIHVKDTCRILGMSRDELANHILPHTINEAGYILAETLDAVCVRLGHTGEAVALSNWIHGPLDDFLFGESHQEVSHWERRIPGKPIPTVVLADTQEGTFLGEACSLLRSLVSSMDRTEKHVRAIREEFAAYEESDPLAAQPPTGKQHHAYPVS